MKQIKRFFQVAWIRLFTGETPLFFKYWGSLLAVLTALSVTLTTKALLAPDSIKDKVQVYTWCFDIFVAILHVITPFMTTKNKAVAQDNFNAVVQEAKKEPPIDDQVKNTSRFN